MKSKFMLMAAAAVAAIPVPSMAQTYEDQRRWDEAQERYQAETERYQQERERYYVRGGRTEATGAWMKTVMRPIMTRRAITATIRAIANGGLAPTTKSIADRMAVIIASEATAPLA